MPKTVETIFFGGMGEPLFHRDILTMIHLAAETGAEVELLTKLPFFIAQHLVDEVNVSNISPTDEASQNEMLYTGLVNMYTGPGKGSVLPTVRLPLGRGRSELSVARQLPYTVGCASNHACGFAPAFSG